jgi:hypothetical protein
VGCVAGAPAIAVSNGLVLHGGVTIVQSAKAIASNTMLLAQSSKGYGADELRKNMEAGGTSFAEGEHAHHIIPKNIDYGRASEGRMLLDEVGIGINDSPNGVNLAPKLHKQRGLHTREAINEVVRRLEQFRGNKTKIIEELQKSE